MEDILSNSFNLMQDLQNKFYKDFVSKQDDILKNALVANGFSISDLDFLKDNFQFIKINGDSFDHLYYHFGLPDEKRIISIQATPDIIFEGNKCSATAKYY